MEKITHRELTRLQEFQMFLVSQIDNLAGSRDNESLILKVNDLKRAVGICVNRILGQSNVLEDLEQTNGCRGVEDSKEQGTQTIGLGYLAEHAKLNSTIAALNEKTKFLGEQLESRFKESETYREEVRKSFSDANDNFNYEYAELNKKYSELQNLCSELKLDLATKTERLRRTKSIALHAITSGSCAPKEAEQTKLERLMGEYRILERKNHELKKRLHRSGVKRNIIERQKHEIVKLHKNLARLTYSIHDEQTRASRPQVIHSSPIRIQLSQNANSQDSMNTNSSSLHNLLRKKSQINGGRKYMTLIEQKDKQLSSLLTTGNVSPHRQKQFPTL